MNFNDHSKLKGLHAFLSPSKYHWVNYTDEKLDDSFKRYLAIQRGTRLHELACSCILEGVELKKSKKTLNMYVNDAIGFRMTPEQPLVYSSNCFGHADTISFRKNKLRIHDLKTGDSPTSMRQLEVYAAIFCLEYRHTPENIEIELRIYQNDIVLVHEPPAEDIRRIMDKIIIFDKRVDKLLSGEER